MSGGYMNMNQKTSPEKIMAHMLLCFRSIVSFKIIVRPRHLFTKLPITRMGKG